MATMTVTDYLKYANLQMAAEALYDFDATLGLPLEPGKPYSGAIDPARLELGNRHASEFTATQAAEFASQWEVVEHKSNSTTGFSGTLFKNKDTGELVLSFRSTEFVDDAARDNQATNKLEVADKGWAFGHARTHARTGSGLAFCLALGKRQDLTLSLREPGPFKFHFRNTVC